MILSVIGIVIITLIPAFHSKQLAKSIFGTLLLVRKWEYRLVYLPIMAVLGMINERKYPHKLLLTSSP